MLFYLRGYLIITVTGNFAERFINVCTAKNILLWDITKISSKSIRCKISIRAFKKLPEIAYKTAVSIKIIKRCGFPFFLQKYRRRKILMVSIFIFVVFVIIINQFVWDIEVRGNETIKTADILSVLEEEGITYGVPKAKINQRNIKTQTMLKLPSLSWLWIDKRGSKLIVEVRERIPVPEIFDPDEYCNIVAQKDGIIDSLTVRNGIPVVSVGDTVLKGMVLVTGKIPSSTKNEIRYVQSDAQVFARVWYEDTEEFSCIETRRIETGKQKRRITIKIFGKQIPLYFSKNPPFEHYNEDVAEYDVSIFGKYLGMSFISRSYQEVTLSEERLSQESVATQGAQIIKEKIEQSVLPDSVLLNIRDSFETIDDTKIAVTVCAEYKENIAVKKKGTIIENEDTTDNT